MKEEIAEQCVVKLTLWVKESQLTALGKEMSLAYLRNMSTIFYGWKSLKKKWSNVGVEVSVES